MVTPIKRKRARKENSFGEEDPTRKLLGMPLVDIELVDDNVEPQLLPADPPLVIVQDKLLVRGLEPEPQEAILCQVILDQQGRKRDSSDSVAALEPLTQRRSFNWKRGLMRTKDCNDTT